MTQAPEGQAEVQEARAAHDAAVDRWDSSLGKAHPGDVEAGYQAMNDTGIRLSEVAGRYPEAWWAAEAAGATQTSAAWEAGRELSTTGPGTPEPEAEA